MAVEFCVISIGTLSRNRLWGEKGEVRTAHATTTLVDDGAGRLILVDPSLTPGILTARFNERTGKHLGDVTDVFCTTLRPVHRSSIAAMPDAAWWTGEVELETYRQYLAGLSDSAGRLDAEGQAAVNENLALVDRFKPAPDKLGEQVGLYPLAGPSAGSAGLLLTPVVSTILIAGDAALTHEHVDRGQVWQGCFDTETAGESLQDLLQVADVIVPGHDNVFTAPRIW